MDKAGFIVIPREVLDWEFCDNVGTMGLFLRLVLEANVEDKVWHGIEVKRGQLITTVRSLTEKTGLTTKQVRTCLERLGQTKGKQICIEGANKYSLITICDYECYSATKNGKGQTKGKQKGNERATTKTKEFNISLSSDKSSDNNISHSYIKEESKEESQPITRLTHASFDFFLAHDRVSDCDEFYEFAQFAHDNYPYVAKNLDLQIKNFYSLRESYSYDDIKSYTASIENSKKRVNYVSWYLTVGKWLKKDKGNG